MIDTLGAYRPTSGNEQSKFGGDTMCRSGDIRARAEASAIGGKSRRRGRSQEDDHGITFEINEFGVREPNSAEIGLAVFEKRSYGRTHRQTESPRMNGSGGCNLQFLQSRSHQQKRRAFSGFFLASAVLSAFVGCVSPIRLYGVPVSGMNAFVELLFVVCCFRGLCFFVVIEFAFCLYSCGFSVWDHRILTLPSWSSAFSPDSVVVISPSSHCPSCDFSVWDYRSLTLPSWPSASSPDSVVIMSSFLPLVVHLVHVTSVSGIIAALPCPCGLCVFSRFCRHHLVYLFVLSSIL
ncbi:uncharacterized protein LOC134198000 [Corticium candelabrum]|uniref:uncharacterized protein LOC134198000 n=1 Tax=Corticium candelabrum TaxID=121492 RepID=UPI002E263A44|nr:uncharacterized protein LOC134198000 [Corticium candelabrum]